MAPLFFLSFTLFDLFDFLRLQFAAHETPESRDNTYYGLLATTDVYNHEIKTGQWVSTAIWIFHDGDGSKLSHNSIHVGWQVSKMFSSNTTQFSLARKKMNVSININAAMVIDKIML